MKTLKLIGLASLLISGIANASLHCNDFKVIVKNDLANDLVVKAVAINKATIHPSFLPEIQANTEQTFTINNSSDQKIDGEFILADKNDETRVVHIKYTLENKAVYCKHHDETPEGIYAVEKDRSTGEVKYTLHNK